MGNCVIFHLPFDIQCETQAREGGRQRKWKWLVQSRPPMESCVLHLCDQDVMSGLKMCDL